MLFQQWMGERPVFFPDPHIVGGLDLSDRATFSTAHRQSSDNDSFAHVTTLDASSALSAFLAARSSGDSRRGLRRRATRVATSHRGGWLPQCEDVARLLGQRPTTQARSYPVEVRPDAAKILSMMVMLATDSSSAKGWGLTPVIASQNPCTCTAY